MFNRRRELTKNKYWSNSKDYSGFALKAKGALGNYIIIDDLSNRVIRLFLNGVLQATDNSTKKLKEFAEQIEAGRKLVKVDIEEGMETLNSINQSNFGVLVTTE